jgi:Ras-related protein Rab-8A
METSAKVNEGVEEAFFTLARSATGTLAFFFVPLISYCRNIKTRLIDSQAENAASGAPPSDSVKVNQPAAQTTQGCCS